MCIRDRLRVALLRSEGGKAMNELKIVGKPEAKIDAIDKVTGSARFVDDICLPEMCIRDSH